MHMDIRESKRILIVSSPIRSRGCAEVGSSNPNRKEGEKVVIAMAAPSRFRLIKLVNLTRHELAHTHGLEHEHMPYNMKYSLGPMPQWAKRFDRPSWPRYLGRAPNQLEF